MMKKITMLVLMFLAAAPMAFADEGEAAQAQPRKVITETILKMEDPDYVSGKVVNILPSDMGRSRAKITVADKDGVEAEFDVKVLAVIYDTKGSLVSLDDIALGTDVEVHYRTLGDNKREATSIKVLR
jgi:hypothetical protein